VAESHIVLDGGDAIAASWAIDNAGDAVGFARLCIDIAEFGLGIAGPTTLVPRGGGAITATWGPFPFQVGVLYLAELSLEQVDNAGNFIALMASHLFQVGISI